MIQWLRGGRHGGGPSEGHSLPGASLVKEEGVQNGWIRTGLGPKGWHGVTELRRKGPACLAGAAGRLFSTFHFQGICPPLEVGQLQGR